jgi:HlyD family secretion protein
MDKRIVVIPAVLLGIGLGCWYYRASASDAKSSTIYGNVDIRDVNLAFRVAGRVADIKVDEGAEVKAGDVIAILDQEPLRIGLENAERAMEALKARSAMLHHGFRGEDIEQTKARLQAARASLHEAEENLARQKMMFPDGATSKRALDNAQSIHDQAAAQVLNLEQEEKLRTTGYRKEEITESDAHFNQAMAQLEIARLALKDAVLTSPSSGVILTRAIEKGSMVQVGTSAVTLSLTDPVWVRAYVSEPQLGKFAPGRKLLLETDSRKGKPYHGTVGFVSPTVEFTPKSVETPDLRTSNVYRIRVVVQDPDPLLRQGMPVTLRIAP